MSGRVLLGALVAAAAVLLGAGPASAHAALVSVSPADGSRLTSAPTEVVLTFDENIRTPAAVIVTGPSGRVDHGGARVVDNRLGVDVRLQPRPAYVGTYRVDYRVVSADGHPVSAEETFRYAPPGVTAAPDQTRTQQAPSAPHRPWWILGVVLVVVLVALLLLVPARRRRGTR